MDEICRIDLCCGCGACSNICPKKAITMRADDCGFKHPQIDAQKCIDCGLCKKTCPINSTLEREEKTVAYATKAKDSLLRKKSQSGGAFSVIAIYLLTQNWIIYGVGFESLSVVYKRITTIEELNDLKNSKYVQADLLDTHNKVEKDLKEGKKVLFSGTPCYVQSLLKYLDAKKIDGDNLVTVDLICYGVPSPKLYAEYIHLEEVRANKKVKSFIFRDKEWSLNEKYSRITFEDDNSMLVNGYLRLFSNKLSTRESCLKCKFASPLRVSDITVGDFWGIENINPEFDDNKGVSCIIPNTNKGDLIINQVLDQFYVYKSTFKDAQKKQKALTNSVGEIDGRVEFWDDYKNKGIEYVLVKYFSYKTSCHVSIKGRHIKTFNAKFLYSHIRGVIKTNMPAPIRKMMRRLLRR